MIKYHTLLVACCLAGFMHAQSWTISGNVSDESNAPLVGVSIYLDGQFVAATDSEGNF